MRFAFALASLLVLLAGTVRADIVDEVAANPPATGALVVRVLPQGAGERVGLRPGDVITHYAGSAVGGSKQLTAAIAAHAEAGGTLELTYVRRGSGPATVHVPAGKLGIAAWPVEQGKPQQLRPPPTDVAFDFSLYETTPRDEWYAMRNADGQHIGFQHHRAEVKDGRLVVTSELASDTAGGPRHLVVTMTATAEPKPRLIETRHEGPLYAEFLCTLTAEGDSGRIVVHLTENGKASERTVDLPDDAMYEYLVQQLVAAMPLRPGTCLHYHSITEQGDVGDPAAALVGEPGMVEVDGQQVAAVPVTGHRLGQKTRTTWVEPATRTIVKFESADGAAAVRTTREQAVAGVNPKLTPRT